MSDEYATRPIAPDNSNEPSTQLDHLARQSLVVCPYEEVRERPYAAEPAIGVQRKAGREICDIERKAPVECSVEASIVPTRKAVRTRLGALRVIRPVVSRGEVCMNVVEQPLQVLGAPELGRVARTILEGVCDEDPVRPHVFDPRRLESDLQLVWFDVKRDLTTASEDLGKGPQR
jgi:hypothetical protein